IGTEQSDPSASTTPNRANEIMSGTKKTVGTSVNFANGLTAIKHSMTAIMLDRIKMMIVSQRKLILVVSNSLPGLTPIITSPASTRAAIGLPGTPSPSVGASAAASVAVTAASAAITPSTLPLPNS